MMGTVCIVYGGDMFTCGADAMVVPVNCVGVPGKGLALDAARRWPGWARNYRRACHAGMRPGTVEGWRGAVLVGEPLWIVSFATKDPWRDPSRLEWVEEGLDNLRRWAWERGVSRLAVPALGCGLGGLAWSDVRPLMESMLAQAGCREVLVFAPRGAVKGGT